MQNTGCHLFSRQKTHTTDDPKFCIGMPVVQMGWQVVYSHMIAKFSWMGSLPHFLTRSTALAWHTRAPLIIVIVCLFFCSYERILGTVHFVYLSYRGFIQFLLSYLFVIYSSFLPSLFIFLECPEFFLFFLKKSLLWLFVSFLILYHWELNVF